MPRSTDDLIPNQALPSWQEELQRAITSPQQLLDYLQLPQHLLHSAGAASRLFQLKVPLPYANRIRPGNLNDPLLKQVLPVEQETLQSPDYHTDPLLETKGDTKPGLIHKYNGRVLLVASPNCAINCRYCFRRHFPYQQNNLNRSQWLQALDTIAADDSIAEIILSGGDPLANSNQQLRWLTQQIEGIPHIKRLRIHTRLPVVIPQRIDADTTRWLSELQQQCVLVLHINHAQEIDREVIESVARIKATGATVFNQAVLLKGINDSASAQVQLCEKLFDSGIIPYYVHLLDKVQGAAHFAVDDRAAAQVFAGLLSQLPGYMVPKFVREIAGEPNKTLFPQEISADYY